MLLQRKRQKRAAATLLFLQKKESTTLGALFSSFRTEMVQTFDWRTLANGSIGLVLL